MPGRSVNLPEGMLPGRPVFTTAGARSWWTLEFRTYGRLTGLCVRELHSVCCCLSLRRRSRTTSPDSTWHPWTTCRRPPRRSCAAVALHRGDNRESVSGARWMLSLTKGTGSVPPVARWPPKGGRRSLSKITNILLRNLIRRSCFRWNLVARPHPQIIIEILPSPHNHSTLLALWRSRRKHVPRRRRLLSARTPSALNDIFPGTPN